MIDKPPLFEGSFGSPEKQAGAPIRDVRQIFGSFGLQQQTAEKLSPMRVSGWQDWRCAIGDENP